MKKIYLLITATICLAACKSGPFQNKTEQRDDVIRKEVKKYFLYRIEELDSITEVTLLQVKSLPLNDVVKFQTDYLESRIETDRYSYERQWISLQQYFGKISMDSLRQIKNDTLLQQVLDDLDKTVRIAEKRKKQIDSLNKMAAANPKDFGGYHVRVIIRIDHPFPEKQAIDTNDYILSQEGKVLVEPLE